MEKEYDQAVDVIRDEMAKESGNPGLCALGEYLTEYLQRHPRAASAITKKTLGGAWGEVVRFARTKATNGAACLTDDEVYSKAREYFGLAGDDAGTLHQAAAKPLTYTDDGFDDLLDLDALLGD